MLGAVRVCAAVCVAEHGHRGLPITPSLAAVPRQLARRLAPQGPAPDHGAVQLSAKPISATTSKSISLASVGPPRELSRAQGPGGRFPRPLTRPDLLNCSSWRASGRGRGVGQRSCPQTQGRGAEKEPSGQRPAGPLRHFSCHALYCVPRRSWPNAPTNQPCHAGPTAWASMRPATAKWPAPLCW